MKLEIKVFKATGKYYTSTVVECTRNIPIFDSKFDEFIAKNLPAYLMDGYAVVSNADPDSTDFYEKLYFIEELLFKYF